MRMRADQLDRELAQRGMTRADLAALAELSLAAVGRAARGEGINPDTFGRIARALRDRPVLEVAAGLLAS